MKHLKRFNEEFEFPHPIDYDPILGIETGVENSIDFLKKQKNSFFNRNLIKKVKKCNSEDELFSIIEEIYPETRSGLDGYEFKFINSFLRDFELVKNDLIRALENTRLSKLVINGPSIRKPGQSWWFIDRYVLKH